jgi:hypothetical protein
MSVIQIWTLAFVTVLKLRLYTILIHPPYVMSFLHTLYKLFSIHNKYLAKQSNSVNERIVLTPQCLLYRATSLFEASPCFELLEYSYTK